MTDLVYFGNENLQKYNEITVSYSDSRNASGQDVQTMNTVRTDGVKVINTKYDSKIITIRGHAKDGTSTPTIELLTQELDRKMSDPDESKYLRFVPSGAYVELPWYSSTSGWTALNDAANVTTTTTNYQYGGSTGTALEFDIDVSKSGGADNAAIAGSAFTPTVDVSGNLDTGNFEFWLYIPDTFYITDIDVRVGNDSSNYYGLAGITTNYESKPIKNGWNLFSVPWVDMTEVGSVTTTAVDYFYLQINYSSSAEDINGCVLDGIQWVNEDRVRNFPCYRQGGIQKEYNHYNTDFSNWSAQFLNHTGYAESTHVVTAVDTVNITSIQQENKFTLEGSKDTRLTHQFVLNTVGQLDSISIRNRNADAEITFSTLSADISDGDILTLGRDTLILENSTGTKFNYSGTVPLFDIGFNRELLTFQGGSTTIEETTADSTYTPAAASFPAQTNEIFAQQFTATADGELSSLLFNCATSYYNDNGTLNGTFNVYVYSDSSNTPDSLLGTFSFDSNTGIDNFSLQGVTDTGITVVNTTKYWVGLRVQRFSSINENKRIDFKYDSTAGYAGGIVKKSTDAGVSWGSAETFDMTFEFQIADAADWDVDYSATYKKLHQS